MSVRRTDLHDEPDQINDYTSQYHHGEDKDDATPDQIDPTELTGFARRTLPRRERAAGVS